VGGRRHPLLISDPRYAPAGVLAPKSKAELAFALHILGWLAVNGTAAIVQLPGVLYRGGAEQKIRKYCVDKNCVDMVIQLPPNLFFGTTIATCIIVLKECADGVSDMEIRGERRALVQVRRGPSWLCRGRLPPIPAPPETGCPQLHRPAATGRRPSLSPPLNQQAPHGASAVTRTSGIAEDVRRAPLNHRRFSRRSTPSQAESALFAAE